MPTTLYENRPSAGIGVVEGQNLVVFCDFVLARATLCGDWRGRGAKPRGFLRFCFGPRDALRGSAWSRCKNSRFFTVLFGPARPSAGIGVVEAQKLEVFYDFVLARATLCGDRRGRAAKTLGFFAILFGPATLCGDRRGRGAKFGSRDPPGHRLLILIKTFDSY